MKPLYDYVIQPLGERYNNSIEVGDSKSLILNTEIFNHGYINRKAVIISTPIDNIYNLQEGQEVIVHHNIFRRWHNIKGIEKNSRGFLNEGEYLASPDQIYMYKTVTWECISGYTFVKPLKNKDVFSLNPEQPLVGIVKYSDGTFLPTQLVGFSPGDEFEFVIEGERLYRVMNRFINIEYEYKGNEEEYNPSWAESSRRAN
jgi:predicted DNA-binding antitoxin AbrB/MazE fold protein